MVASSNLVRLIPPSSPSTMTEGVHHILVPTHSKLGAKEKKDLLDRYHVKVHELPRILKSDPAIEHLSPEEGDVIKVIRPSATAGTAIFYRGVISD